MISFSVDANLLKAAVLCAATGDVRYYLNGIHIFRTGKGTLSLTATDGHCLFWVDTLSECPENFPEKGVIVPCDTVKAIKTTKRTIELPVVFSADMSSMQNAVWDHNGNKGIFDPIEATFPGIGKLWPEKFSPSSIFVDPEVSGKVCKAFEIAGFGQSFEYALGNGGLYLSSECGRAYGIALQRTVRENYRRPAFCQPTMKGGRK